MDPSLSGASTSLLDSAVRAHTTNPVEGGFGTYGPARCWNRGVGNGYHEPLSQSRIGAPSMNFKDWMAKWTSPELAVPTATRVASHPRRLGTPSTLQSVPALNGSRPASCASTRSRADDSMPAAGAPRPLASTAAPFKSAPRTGTYPNPANWKRATSLPTRTPGYVGANRTR
eukprot:CAMPEP_0195083370 /NCGR_PEP_ID=MMETSP0448-20130528/24331_1 /TAXON_ID=66468 /ORGANISM="Heterocapsa triquestra, Strain CCMP 448" /LENGTH=171 /DNA_ID=CAMNT_0040116567 /DNA_START=24 /DNA_END=539 /DNA_ORIENTATION=-